MESSLTDRRTGYVRTIYPENHPPGERLYRFLIRISTVRDPLTLPSVQFTAEQLCALQTKVSNLPQPVTVPRVQFTGCHFTGTMRCKTTAASQGAEDQRKRLAVKTKPLEQVAVGSGTR